MKKAAVIILSICLMIFLMSSPAFSLTYIEDFADPLGDWTTDWFYLNSNAENYYVANGNCDPNNRGNEPNGIWISDDRGCGNLVRQSPVTINLLNHFGDNATSFSIDMFTCQSGVTFNVYDRNGSLDTSIALPSTCFTHSNYNFALTNGISAFEFTGPSIEGNTAIDNVSLVIPGTPSPPTSVPTMNEWGMIIFIVLAGLGSVYYLRRQRRA